MADYLHRRAGINQRAREVLKKRGHTGALQKVAAIVYAIEVETGRACAGDQTEYIAAWLDSLPTVPRREPPKFEALTIKPLSMMRHNLDRAALAEPKIQATAGRAGNGDENSPVWRR
ncbi:hypothetical protein ABRZ04_04415 [Castellaniella ginsengisoli]|uniref:Uncharacterized protein n=1 Tax=Castellaniella ginsengisoli TaxID=546114 RepID=A0AB39D0G4_9BURK